MPGPDEGARASDAQLYDHMRRRLTRAAVVANCLGGLDVFVFLSFLVPVTLDGQDTSRLLVLNGSLVLVSFAVSLPLGVWWAQRRAAPLAEWLLRTGGPAGERERRLALAQPLEFGRLSALFWGLGAVLFGVINAAVSLALGIAVGATIFLGGLTTAALGYLLAERIMRPVVARALDTDPPAAPASPGVTARLTTAWALATGIPLLGTAGVAIAQLAGQDVAPDTTAGAILFLVMVAAAVGLLATVVAARSVAEPIAAVRDALARVEDGDFSARVRVDDGSEVGMLQAGFNRMAAGLAERERLRDLFGRHVGHDVARAAAEGEIPLGGEEREVGALFADVVGSTALAAERPATEVVAVLNSFFCIVVEVVEAHGGFVNKFEGDAALCVFGAPVARPMPAADALAAARELRERLPRELPDVDVGIGVSAGVAVAGNVGSEERFEYTVIGDPVNEAARLCELAKRRPERLLASHSALERAGRKEAGWWRVGEVVELRGRPTPTRLALPVGVVDLQAAWRSRRRSVRATRS